MISKLQKERKLFKILKSCFKFVFLNKKFKKRNQCYIHVTFFNVMIKERQNT
jgi:hypothetical protein